jgi:transcriptional regulator with XRE-family HTH domain
MDKGITEVRYRKLLATLVEARKSAGLSQADVAVILSKTQQFVSRYELGERRLDVIEYVDIAAALGLDGLALLTNILSAARAKPASAADVGASDLQ